MSTATGATGIAQETLKNLIADSTTFRTWVGATGDNAQAQARNRVHEDRLVLPTGEGFDKDRLEGLRPFAVVGTGGPESFTAERESRAGWLESGVVFLTFEDDVAPAIRHDPTEYFKRFRNNYDAVIAEVQTAAVGVWDMGNPSIVDGPNEKQPEETETQGLALSVTFAIPWGPGGG